MKIDKSKYQGYLWYSNQKEPEVFNNITFEKSEKDAIEKGQKIIIEKELEKEISVSNPFIVEGHLYDGENSISIKYIDGQYIIMKYKLGSSDEKNPNVEIKEFLPNRMEGVGKLRFLEYWKPQEDSFCENMKVLQPAELVFVGFKNKEE